MSSRYQSPTNYVPWIAGVILLAVFVGIVVWATGDKDKEQATWNPPPVKNQPPRPEPEADPEPEPDPEPIREKKPRLSAGQAEKFLRKATVSWRQFTVKLCRTQKWNEDKAVAFLQEVTWSDRDKEKQHAQGLKALGRMLGVTPEDPVALANALFEQGSLEKYFEKNWSKLDVKYEAKEEVTVLEDAWKATRERWGFPLDTPIDQLREFKMGALAQATQMWQQLALAFIRQAQKDATAAQEQALRVIGRDPRTQETKMLAAMRVLLGKPDATVKGIVEEFVSQTAGKEQKELVQSLMAKMGDAIQAAEDAQ